MAKLRWLLAVPFVIDFIVHFGVANITIDDLDLPIYHKTGKGNFSVNNIEDATSETNSYLSTGAATFEVFAEAISKRFSES